MTEEREVNSPESEMDEAPSVAASEPTLIKCHTCQKEFPRKGPNSKFCAMCQPARKQVALAKKTDKRKASSFVYDSTTEPTKPEGKELLRARGLKNEHVIDLCYDMALSVAEQVGIPANRFLLANGVSKALASYTQKAPQLLEPVPAEPIVGELSNLAELKCIHDFSIAWREDAVDFTEFLRLRRLSKMDAFELGLLLGKDFEDAQKNWTEFLPRFSPDTLPANYTQKEMRMWLDSISPVKDYLLMASRNSMKSSFVLVWLLTLHLCCPDARALLVSETQKLSGGFIRSYRNYWEVQPRSETMLQKLFPEYCIRVGEGSEMNFRSPMAHLNLIQPSASKSSAETAETGGRAEVIIEDDIISNLTVGTEEQIQKSINVHSLLQKLREVLGSFTVVVGTPWASSDLYAHLLNQAEKNKDEAALASRIDPIVEVKPSARHKLTPALLTTLVEEDVGSYLLPVRMPWRFIKKEIAANATFALSQNFCVFPLEQDAELRCQFDHDELVRATKHKEFFGHPITQTVASLDRAFSLSKYADLSCIVVGRVQVVESKQALVIIDSKFDRWKESELVRNLVDMIQKHTISVLVGQQDKGWAELSEAIRRQCAIRGVPTPWLRFQPIDNTSQAKARRVKKLELPLSDSRLFFVSSHWTEAALLMMEKFDGVTKSSSRKDDFPDALAQLWDAFGPKYSEEVPAEDLEQRRRDEEEESRRARRTAQYQAMFGGEIYQPPPPKTEESAPEKQRDGRYKVFGSRGPWRL
jgi:hypothetical protein